VRLYEHEGKTLLEQAGITVPKGTLVSSGSAADAESAAGAATFPAAVKSQVLTGGRMKAGGIAFAEDADQLNSELTRLLGSEIRGHRVETVLVEPRTQFDREFYLGITYDSAAKSAVAVFSQAGGIDVEQAGAAVKAEIPLLLPASGFRFKELLASAGLQGRLLSGMTGVFTKLAGLFRDYDCILAEINPLVLTPEGKLVALDVHVELDDDALYRHADLVKQFGLEGRDADARERSPLERKAEEIDSADHRGGAGRMVEVPGNLGLLIGGGGASLTAFDAVQRHGGKPANYCEIGGNPSVWKVKELTKLLLSREDVERIAVIMNVVSNTRVDLVARGVVKGILELGLDPAEKIAIFRIPGAWEEDGFALLRKYGVPYADRTVSIDQAAKMAVAGAGGER